MDKPHNPEETLFDAARALKDSQQRAAFLSAACQHDPALRQRVERLLADATAAADYFDQIAPPSANFSPAGSGAESATVVAEDLAERTGTVIGKYKLLQQIGEGGMGVVYMAEQTVPFDKRVALKIIKLGMDTKAVVARFEAERQALALMNHPNIAKVLDAGATDTGRPYFVMELVKGVPITEYCDKQKLSTKERLELFIPVCQAIQHAHQKGIIHRDIKPSNVMVALFDGRPVPMVIDFGIAKATNQRLTQQTVFTNLGQLIGTPAYMSPEQAEGSQLDIDTRSDIYSLGVLLYELLTGSQPFPEKQLRSAGWKEMIRIIQEDEPPRPSTRLSTLTDPEQSAVTGAHPEGIRKISLLLRRELDWIVMMCLEKDRAKRYETANGLAMDVARYLKGEAIVAVPPTWRYQLSKLARKHKKTFAMAAAIAVILAVATVFSTHQSIVAKRERDVATAVSDFLDKDLLQRADVYGSDPFQTPHRDLLLLDVVNRASTNLQGKFKDQPVVEASIRLTLGKIFIGVGEWPAAKSHLEEALKLFERSVGANDARTVETKFVLGRLELERHQLDKSEAFFKEVIEWRTQQLGERHRDTLEATIGMAKAQHLRNNWAKAEDLFAKVRVVAEADTGHAGLLTLQARTGEILAQYFNRRGRQIDCKSVMKEIIEDYRQTVGSDHPLTLFAMFEAANMEYGPYEANWNLVHAHALLSEIIERSSAVTGDAFPKPQALGFLSGIRNHQGYPAEALEYQQQGKAVALRLAGTNHPVTIGLLVDSDSLRVNGFPEKELPHSHEQTNLWHLVTGESFDTFFSIFYLRHNFEELQRWDDFNETWRISAERQGLAYGLSDPRHMSSLFMVASRITRTGHFSEAAEVSDRLLAMPTFGDGGWALAAMIFSFAGRTNDVAQTIQGAYQRLASNWVSNASATFLSNQHQFEFPTMCLLVLGSPVGAAQLVSKMYKSPESSPHARIIFGLAKYRTGEFQKAEQLVRPLFENCPEPYFNVLAGFTLAMSLHGQNQSTEARAVVDACSKRVDRLIAAGILTRRVIPDQHWERLTMMWWIPLLRKEAELLIHGRETSIPLTEVSMAKLRDSWQPVRTLLEAGIQHARHQRWSQATDSFRGAIQHPKFAWEAANDIYPDLKLQMALVFVLAGDRAAYQSLCEPPVNPTWSDLHDMFSTAVWFESAASDTNRITASGWRPFWLRAKLGETEWRVALRGLSDYAAGDLAEAGEKFAGAEKTFRATYSCFAQTMHAAVEARQQQPEKARELIAQAEVTWDRLVKNHPNDWAADWMDMALCEMAFREARRYMPAIASR